MSLCHLKDFNDSDDPTGVFPRTLKELDALRVQHPSHPAAARDCFAEASTKHCGASSTARQQFARCPGGCAL